jgi:hypothetical protein
MQTPSDARQVRLFCLEHGRPTTDYAAATIFCDRDERDGHLLARDFPFADDWEYCCDCECFYALEQARKARAAGGWDEERCPACGRDSIRHYLCAGCKVVSHKSGDKVRAVYSITATGLVRPTCPGCLAAAPPAVEEHECHILGLNFTTARASCPFCKLNISREPTVTAAIQDAPARGGEADDVGPAKAELSVKAEPSAKSATVETPAPATRTEPLKAAKDMKAAPSDGGRNAPAIGTLGTARAAKDSAASSEVRRKITATQQTQAVAAKSQRRITRRAILSAIAIVLTLAYVAATAFYFLSREESETPPVSPSVTGDARSRLVPQARLDSARDESNAARKKADDSRAKWEKFRAETIKNGKNPDDLQQAPRTVAAKKEYEAAAAEAQAKSREYERLVDQDKKAREELRAGGAAPPGTSAPSPNQGSAPATTQQAEEEGLLAAVPAWLTAPLADVPAWLTTALAALSPLSLALAVYLVTCVWKLGSDDEEAWSNLEALHFRVKRQTAELKTLSSELSHLSDTTEQRLAQLRNSVQKLMSEVDRVGRAFSPPSHVKSAPAAKASAPSVAIAPGKENLDFPISVGSFLSHIPDRQQMPIKLDPLKNILVKDQEGLGLLMLVRDMSVRGDQLCMVPGMRLLRSAQEYHYNYEKFYECKHPMAGEVWIYAPALVDRVDGGWKLLEKGQLEMK